MLSFIKNSGTVFRKVAWSELEEPLENPGRGWYRIYRYRLREGLSEVPVKYSGETLALVLIDIGDYKDRELDETAIENLHGILDAFAGLHDSIILRICYDAEGKGMVCEPSLFSQVKKQMEVIAGEILPYADHILVFQGLLVGKWGEMHGSKFLGGEEMRILTECFLEKTEGKIPLAVRRPVHYRAMFEQGTGKGPIGFFNDGMLGSVTHLGTFAPMGTPKGAWREMWGPADEREFMKPFIDEVPYGGEAVAGEEELSAEAVVRRLGELRVSYLNAVHDGRLLEKWKQMSYKGRNLYDYVGEHLGYRLLVRDGDGHYEGNRFGIRIKLQNTGFGELYDDGELEIYRRRDAAGEREKIGEGKLGRTGRGGREMQVWIPLDLSQLPAGEKKWELDLAMKSCRSGQAIRFSQKSDGVYLHLGTLYKRW